MINLNYLPIRRTPDLFRFFIKDLILINTSTKKQLLIDLILLDIIKHRLEI